MMVPRRWRHRLRRHVPLLGWLLVLVAVAVLYGRQHSGLVLTGHAEVVRLDVAPEVGGRLSQLAVGLHEDVQAGQLLAMMDDTRHRLELRAARAELTRLSDELERDALRWRQEAAALLSDQRRFQKDEASAIIDHLEVVADLAEARAELRGAEQVLARTEALVSQDLDAQQNLDTHRADRDALAARVTGLETQAGALGEARRAATARREAFVAQDSQAVTTPQPLRGAIEAQEARIELAATALSACVLVAPARGRVAAVNHQTGELVAAGAPVLTLTGTVRPQIVSYLPEGQLGRYRAGAVVAVRRLAAPGETMKGTLVSTDVGISPKPQRVLAVADIPEWGQAVVVALPDSVMVRPGEAFELVF